MKFILSPRDQALQVAEVLVHCLDDENAKQFCAELHDALKNAKAVVLDLSKVFFIDVSALGHLIDLRDRLKARDIDMRLCKLHGSVLGLFEIAQLGNRFRLHASLEEALSERQDSLAGSVATATVDRDRQAAQQPVFADTQPLIAH